MTLGRNGRIGMLLTLVAVLCVSAPTTALTMAENLGSTDVVEKDWALYIYCGADNDYEVSAVFALEQCAKALGEESVDPGLVNVVVYLDTQGEGTSEVYEVTPDDWSAAAGWDSKERDSSAPETLNEFLNFAMVEFPGTNSMVVVKNGHAWCGVCPDWNSQDEKYLMPIDGLATALEGRDIDVLALDGDNMASIEVAYELRNSADYFVGTQQDMPLDGLPYYLMIKDMGLGVMSAEEVAVNIVDNHVYYYNNTEGKKVTLDHLLSNSQMAVTAAAFKMGDEGQNMVDIAEAFNDTIAFMMKNVTEGGGDPWAAIYRNVIASARDTALIGKMGDQAGYEWLPDVYTWLEKVVEYYELEFDRDQNLVDVVDAFHGAFDDALVHIAQCQILDRSGNSFPHGLNIWFPPSWVQWESLDYTRTRTYLYDGANVELPAEYYCVDCPFDYNNIDLDFVEDTMWMDFFDLYYDARWTIYGNPDAPKETPLWK
ncbi:MAG: clostripain-related cysteine peptidase [Candidatus Thermoplasmatota archaeon]|nr:clostripain-related cysteine peptidase [Candidatus Thermoplasmatota archaeon]